MLGKPAEQITPMKPPHQQDQVTTLFTLQFHPSATANRSLLHFHQQFFLLVKEEKNPTLVYTRSLLLICWPATQDQEASSFQPCIPLYPYTRITNIYRWANGWKWGLSRKCRCVSRKSRWFIQMSYGFTCISEPYSLYHCNLLSGGAEFSTWRHTSGNLPNYGHGYHTVRHGRTASSTLNKLEECSCEDRSISMHAQGIQHSPVLATCTRFIRKQSY